MSLHTIHSERRKTTCGWDVESQEFFISIFDTEHCVEIFTSERFEDHLFIDEVLHVMTTYEIPVPKNFREQLLSDRIDNDSATNRSYHFDHGEKSPEGLSHHPPAGRSDSGRGENRPE